ncbi:hypothetical protein HK097_006117 [Rhizophlyctis rosea]|uniref:Uncharacterized protein n=1 Tax=Rhizophlyctis rosea TaxID=64517 RepID=A0AAD5SEG2_9FUNG|nr:hypothetical protein HK097_006117 [Rhizophlyctis rosea]
MVSKPTFPPLTKPQKVYVILMHCVGAGLLDAAINFGIATAMYRPAAITSPDATRLWALPNSLAGDAVVTVLVQQTLTWFLDGALTRKDLRKGAVAPWPYALPEKGVLGWICGESLDVFGPAPVGREGVVGRVKLVVGLLLRGFVTALMFVIPAWCIGVGLLIAFWPAVRSGAPVSGWPGPQIFKALYTFFLGAVTTPFSTLVAMAQAAKEKRLAYSAEGDDPNPPFELLSDNASSVQSSVVEDSRNGVPQSSAASASGIV